MSHRRWILPPLAAALLVGLTGCPTKTDEVIPSETASPVERGPEEGAGGVPPDTPVEKSTYPTTTPPPEGPPPEGRPGGTGEGPDGPKDGAPSTPPNPGADSAQP
jgi:hypothetical protein